MTSEGLRDEILRGLEIVHASALGGYLGVAIGLRLGGAKEFIAMSYLQVIGMMGMIAIFVASHLTCIYLAKSGNKVSSFIFFVASIITLYSIGKFERAVYADKFIVIGILISWMSLSILFFIVEILSEIFSPFEKYAINLYKKFSDYIWSYGREFDDVLD